MSSISPIPSLGSMRGKRVLLRAGMNVPVAGGKVANDFRLDRLLPTLRFLVNERARIIILGHLGNGTPQTLSPVARYLARDLPARFFDKPPHLVSRDEIVLNDGEIVILENVRMSPGEKEGDSAFGRHLASLGDVFVNDAFADSHRRHASIVRVPEYLPSALGFDFMLETKELSALFSPPAPFLVIIGGAKIATKLPLIEKFLPKADRVFVGGALANTLYRERGWEIGCSLADVETAPARRLLEARNLIVPERVIVRAKNGGQIEKAANEVLSDENIIDAGPGAVTEILSAAREAACVLWNGPLGNFELGYGAATETLAHGLANLPCDERGTKARVIIGGGDTIASIEKFKLFDQFSFVSTGGGAMLEFLATETLPGIEAILKSKATAGTATSLGSLASK